MTDQQVTYLLDANVLVALALTTHVHHRLAHASLDGMSAWCTTPATETALVRLLLTPQVTGVEWGAADALGQLRAMRADPRWSFVPDDGSLADAIISTSTLTGRLQVTDLHLVDLAARHGLRLATLDRRMLEWLPPRERQHVEVISDLDGVG